MPARAEPSSRSTDSVAVAPSKWLSVPIEAGVVLVRDGAAMRDAFSLVPAYLRTDGDPHGVGGPVWFSEYGIQQTRGFRAPEGVDDPAPRRPRGLPRHAIDLQIELAETLQAVEAARRHGIGRLWLRIVCLRYAPPDGDDDDDTLDAVNRRILHRLQLGGEAFVSGTILSGRFALRACIVNYKTQKEDIDRLGRACPGDRGGGDPMTEAQRPGRLALTRGRGRACPRGNRADEIAGGGALGRLDGAL